MSASSPVAHTNREQLLHIVDADASGQVDRTGSRRDTNCGFDALAHANGANLTPTPNDSLRGQLNESQVVIGAARPSAKVATSAVRVTVERRVVAFFRTHDVPPH
jgi:hypothetical protein